MNNSGLRDTESCDEFRRVTRALFSILSRILFTAWPLRGHCVQLLALAEELRLRGHQVALAVPEPGNRWAEDIGIEALSWEPIGSRKPGDFSRELACVFRAASRMTRPWCTELMFTRFTFDCYARVKHGVRPVFARFRPDLVVTDYAMLPSVEIAHDIAVPTIRVSCFIGPMGHPGGALPHWASGSSQDMNRRERVHNRLLGMLDALMALWQRGFEVRRGVRGRSAVTLASLLVETPVLVGSCFGVEIPQSLPRQIRLVGPIRREPGLHIPTGLSSWLEAGTGTDVVYVSFGTLAVLERHQVVSLMRGLTRAGLRVLWSLPRAQHYLAEGLPAAVRVESYVAQDAILAHPAVRFFVTHGGRNSLHESLWYGRAMLCIPFFGDQYYNAARLVDAGAAVRIHKHELDEATITAAARQLMSRRSFADAAARLGVVLRDARGRERASDMIECALQSGVQQLLDPSTTGCTMDDTRNSLPNDYFDRKYEENLDPWNFATSEYERLKYADTLAVLGDGHYQMGLEIGCSIGVLTRQLANRCTALLAVDVAELALEQARARCAELEHIRFRNMRIPDEFPSEMFDLILLSEVGYFFAWPDLRKLAHLMCKHLVSGGRLLLVHYFPEYPDHPLTGDEVHDFFLREASDLAIEHTHGHRAEFYRLDLFTRRVGERRASPEAR